MVVHQRTKLAIQKYDYCDVIFVLPVIACGSAHNNGMRRMTRYKGSK